MSESLFSKINLETKRLVVRPVEMRDAEQLHAVVSQPQVMKFLPEDVMTLDEVSEVISWLETCHQKNTSSRILKWTLGILRRETSQVIGWCGLGPLDFSPDEIELFCGLSESYWGEGIAAEACNAVVDYAFSTIGLNRIVAVVDPENLQSRRLVEKLGMRLEKRVIGLSQEFRHYEGFEYYSITVGQPA